MRVWVIAVERDATVPPVEALVVRDSARGRTLLRWWGGLSWETLHDSEFEGAIADESNWQRFEIDLPDDWEDGYLTPMKDGALKFVYGRQPRREDWEARRFIRRFLRKLRRKDQPDQELPPA